MKKFGVVLLFLVLLLVTAACIDQRIDNFSVSKPDDINTPQSPDTPKDPDDILKPDPPYDPDKPDDPLIEQGNINPLTGLYDGISDSALSHRPVAVMIGNTSDSLPQWGVSQADIIYEMLAEGRSTRLMAIFQDPSKITSLASIRSARPYFIDIAQSYGAVFIHFGGSVPAYEAIAKRTDLISIDGISGSWEGTVFFRDPSRRKLLGSEHSVYTTGSYLKLGLSKLNKPLEQNDHPSAFVFSDESSAQNGKPAAKVQITFKDKHKPYFIYDAASGNYLRFMYGKPQTDGINNQQISVKNVLVLRMKTTDIVNDPLGIIDVETVGSGNGYYFCEGKYVEITWKKDSYNAPIRYYISEGEELVCKPGQSFISVVTIGADVFMEG